MIYYFITFLLISFSYPEALRYENKIFKLLPKIFIFILLLFVGLRYNVGADWDAYFYIYHNNEESTKFEIGYSIVNDLFSSLGLSYNLYLTFINGISLYLIYKYLKNHSRNILFIGILIFFSDLYLYFNFSGIRQAIAISITCFSTTYILKNQFKKFVFFIILASTFHLSSLIFIVAYFIPRTKIHWRHLLLALLSFFILSLYINSLSDFLTDNTIKNANYYLLYQEKNENLADALYIGTIKRFIIIGLIIFFSKSFFKIENSQYFFNLYLLGCAIFISTYMISPDIGTRLSSYFIIFDMILAGMLISSLSKTINRMIIITVFAGMAIYKITGYVNNEFYHYKSVLDYF